MHLLTRSILWFSGFLSLTFIACVAPRDRFDGAATIVQREMAAMRARSKTPAVSVAVAHRGRIVYAGAFGDADIELDVEATAATRFGIGSITKCLTSVAAVSMARDGLLDLDAPLETYLPDFAHAGEGVTIRSILTHTTGLDDTFAAEHYWTTKAFTIQEAADLIEHDGLAFEPGTAFRYATGSFTLVGAAMERVAGQGFENLLAQRVLDRARMSATVVNRPREIIEQRSRFYVPGESGDGPKHALTYDPSHKLPGAGYLATATDLARFGDALVGGELLDEAGMNRLWADQRTADGSSTGYVIGFQLHEDPEHGRVYHLPGGGPGISAWLMLYPRYRMTFAILSNMTRAPVAGSEFGVVQDAFLRVAADP